MGSEMLKTLYMDGSIKIAESEDGVFLHVGEQIYSLTSHAYEPCLYIQSEDKSLITIHDAITVEDIRSMAESKRSTMLIAGAHHDIKGICMLLSKALTLSMESVNMSYLEGCCFLDYLDKCGAISEETAVTLKDSAIDNPYALIPFLESKKIYKTNDGRYYLTNSLLSRNL